MIESVTIAKKLPEDSVLNYDFLRATGIRHIQELAGHIWTDHNAHDPGITILEQLCYAITDLAYRIDNKIPDLLARKGGSAYQDLFGPADILTSNPVTLLDIRKLVIDVPGVKNAWIEGVEEASAVPYTLATREKVNSPSLKGLYRVVFEKDESAETNSGLLGKVTERLHAHRGICEDFAEVKLLDPQMIRLQGTIEVGQVEDVNQMAADVLLMVAAHISPPVPFYTLSEMLSKGKKVDEIFDGPALNHGFIEDYDLKRTKRKEALHTSDFIREIMDLTGVLAVNGMAIATGSATRKSWALTLDQNKTPKLDVRGTLASLKFAKQGLEASIDAEKVTQIYLEKRDARHFPVLSPEDRDIVLPEPEDRDLEGYFSIQNQFPTNYGIGTIGLSDSANPARKAQAKQLKSYLLFFEQLLANYFSQIAHFKDLVGFGDEETSTYFNQSLLGSIPGMEEIITSPESYQQYLEEMHQQTPAGLERKNRFLNHLLARFSETFADYGMLLQGHGLGESAPAAPQLITDKARFLQDYPTVSSGRGSGSNYKSGTDQGGLKKRIARKLGISNHDPVQLSNGDEEGFHLIEHILLRPTPANSPRLIAEFAESTRAGFTICTSFGHGLETGDEIRLQGSTDYDGIHLVERLSKDSFEIEVPFVAPTGNTPQEVAGPVGEWESTRLDLRHLILSDAIDAFSDAPQAGHTRCQVKGHGLREGDKIEVLGTNDYNGVYTVSVVDEDHFDLAVAFGTDEVGGRWIPLQGLGDLYSLQLTCVFPDWTGRYQNSNFKRFVETLVREETPAHLNLHIQWLNQEEMQRFEQVYTAFKNTLVK